MEKESFFDKHRALVISILLIGVLVIASTLIPSRSATYGKIDNLPSQFSVGDDNARVKIIQYSDFLCPSCSQVSLSVMPEIIEKYVDTNQVKIEFRTMSFVAAGSQLAAEGAYCAADQDKFWQYHDEAYKEVWDGYFSKGVDPRYQEIPLYNTSGVENIAKIAGVDEAKFNECLTSRAKRDTVTEATRQYQAAGVSGTPYITVNDIPIKGTPTFDTLNSAIKAQL